MIPEERIYIEQQEKAKAEAQRKHPLDSLVEAIEYSKEQRNKQAQPTKEK